MDEHLVLSLAVVVGFGMGAQWLAWRLRLPSIVVLLLFGFVAGAGVTGLVNPDEMFGDLLFPVVSLFVSIILFEGGLSLRVSELKEVTGTVRNLISIGVVVTWLSATGAAWWLLGMDMSLALLLGAVLTVTGPTVIGPLLRHVRPSGCVGPILKWEGIVNDPIGAMLAVLVAESIVVQKQTTLVLEGILYTIVFGFGIGLLAAGILVVFLRRYWIPDYRHSTVALALAVVAFALSNQMQPESGLLAVTVMGVVLANQKTVNIKHIVEFKENLRVLLISILFIILAPRIQLDDLWRVSTTSTALFIAVLILVIRPVATFLSTFRSQLSLKERIFLSWIAPRGVVAAAVAPIFALRLNEFMPAAEVLVPLMFVVIISTVTVYGLTASPLARWLGLAHPNPQGVLFIGADSWT